MRGSENATPSVPEPSPASGPVGFNFHELFRQSTITGSVNVTDAPTTIGSTSDTYAGVRALFAAER